MRVMHHLAIAALGAALCWPAGVLAQAPADTQTPAPTPTTKPKQKRAQAQTRTQTPPPTTQRNEGRKATDCLSQQSISYIGCPGAVPSADTGPHRKDIDVKGFGSSGVQSAPAASDIQLKRDVAQVGQLDNGIKLYRFRYIWSDQVYVGVMAQQVAAIAPEAVVMAPNGYLAVYYDRLGLKLQTLQQWQNQ